MRYWYYEASDGRDIYWSDKELTEEEQRKAGVHFVYNESRLYGRLNNGKHRPYIVRKVSPKQRVIPKIIYDPRYPNMPLLRVDIAFDEK